MPPDPSLSARVPISARIASLDQFRGYTMLGMFIVNFVGFFTVVPATFKHHNTYCSYADTIMPQFFFAVGYAYRLTFLRRAAAGDRRGVYAHYLKRSLGLILVGAILYVGEPALENWLKPRPVPWDAFLVRALYRDLFQALVHIGVTCLWILPVIGARPAVRVGFAVVSSAIHLALSLGFYYHWVTTAPGIDGGVLGFMTWSVPTLAGSLAYDMVADRERRAAIGRLVGWGLLLMLAGYAISCLNLLTPPNRPAGVSVQSLLVEPPFVPPTRPVNLWTMSQRAGSLSYLTFSAGFSLALYALFVWACDVRGLQIGLLRTFGTNALAGYVIHGLIDQFLVKPFTARDMPAVAVLAALAVFLAMCYACLLAMEKKGVFLRL